MSLDRRPLSEANSIKVNKNAARCKLNESVIEKLLLLWDFIHEFER